MLPYFFLKKIIIKKNKKSHGYLYITFKHYYTKQKKTNK